MSFVFEVYYRAPADVGKETGLTNQVRALGGRLDYREELCNGADSICLTFEFDDLRSARLAADRLREQGEHVEGPGDYGD
jgi:hypothetical protein